MSTDKNVDGTSFEVLLTADFYTGIVLIWLLRTFGEAAEPDSVGRHDSLLEQIQLGAAKHLALQHL